MTPPDAALFDTALAAPPRSQALYRRYRSRDFAELVGQEAIVRTLQNALESGRVAHAYLFCGPRGTGKTSTARLLAKAINCLAPPGTPRPCNACAACAVINENRTMDLIEIDAASNSGVDEIRELRERVNFRPSELRKKVYIIDEVHMLSVAAFNALLKTLEEPPEYVVFVLATTDPQKLPATVLSRCQRFDFRRIPLGPMVAHLRAIAAQEGLATEPGVLELIARQSTGAMRDALSLLDQLMAYTDGILTLAQVQDVLGARGAGEIAAFVDCLIARDLPAGLAGLHAALDHGADLRQFNRQVVEHLRALLLLRAGGDPALLEAGTEEIAAWRAQADRTALPDLSAWLRAFTAADATLRNPLYGALPLEMALVEASLPTTERGVRNVESPAPTPAQPAREVAPPSRPPSTPPAAPRSAPAEPPVARAAAPPPIPPAVPIVEPSVPSSNGNSARGPLDLGTVVRAWNQIADLLKSQPMGRTLAAQMADMLMAWPVRVTGNTILIGFQYDAHRSRLAATRTLMFTEDIFSQALGCQVRIEGAVCPPDTRPAPAAFAAAPAPPAPVAPAPAPPPAPLGTRASKARAIFEDEDDPPL